MKKIFYILSILLVLLTIEAEAQYYNYGNTLTVSYFGEHMFHPGTRIGYEWPALTNKIKTKHRTSHSLMLHPGIGYYLHSGNHHGLFLNSEIGYNVLFFFGVESRINIGVGYLRTFLDGETYEMTSDGNFKKIPLAGNNTFMPSLSLHLAYDFSRVSNLNFGIFIKPSFFMQIPYNTFALPQYAVELGIKYHLKEKKKEDIDKKILEDEI